ncbi:S26 family signal peptidase [Stutzerimonas zhaodongensis]|uniref:S26 family signal peptidase n=1 Tax=Stutzerimonas zhaodongensis TaxID=1176257 RepID=A0A3M2HJM3_9GAMM|nr:S26 family signal peptidase [Stutzerimonas zhaodongensis]MCQ4317759.1 S26 family signal peptidase [Stutzerimonas zhaodongensis]RMH87579.1 S26 family signal peptidase [Stutzerimonas zhaodongensis]
MRPSPQRLQYWSASIRGKPLAPANRIVIGLAATGLIALGWAMLRTPCSQIVYNASASMPTGWYRITPGTSVRREDTVLVRLPPGPATLAAARGYLPANVPLIKQVFATSPSRVCIRATQVLVDDRVVARWHSRDRSGRALPRWSGCRRLTDDEIWLMSADHPDSFDSRYFGPLTLDSVLGVAEPLRLD